MYAISFHAVVVLVFFFRFVFDQTVIIFSNKAKTWWTVISYDLIKDETYENTFGDLPTFNLSLC